MLIICFPNIREALWRMSAGLTLRSEIDSSLSYAILIKPPIHAPIGSCWVLTKRSDSVKWGTKWAWHALVCETWETRWRQHGARILPELSGRPIPATVFSTLEVQRERNRQSKSTSKIAMSSPIHRMLPRTGIYARRSGQDRRLPHRASATGRQWLRQGSAEFPHPASGSGAI